MHNLFKKAIFWGLAGIMVAGLMVNPATARRVDAKGGHDTEASLSAKEKSSLLTTANTVTFIGNADTWKYHAKPKAPSQNWVKRNFKDDAWKSGPAPLGYGNRSQATTVDFGPDVKNKYITTYFRRTFQLDEPKQVESLTLTLVHDDGAIVYLNGARIARPHMSAKKATYKTLSIACDNGETNTISIDPKLLKRGKNVLAVEIHQCSQDSANMIFNAKLTGTLKNGQPKPTDFPTKSPTAAPTDAPTAAPTEQPTIAPTDAPTAVPTQELTAIPTTEPTQQPTTAPTPAPVPGLPPAASGQTWQMVWSDDFNGSSVDTSKWQINNKYRSEDTNRTFYRPENVSVSDGTLKLTVKKETYNGAGYTGGMLESRGAARRNLYGYYEARIRYNFVGPGFWANFWMCGVDRWPPEFDNEIVTQSNHVNQVYQGHHYRDASGTHLSAKTFTNVTYNDWHTYGVKWMPGEPVQFYLDGKLTYTSAAPLDNPPGVDMYVSLRAGAFYDASWGGKPDSTTQYPGLAEYDWVRVYQAVPGQ